MKTLKKLFAIILLFSLMLSACSQTTVEAQETETNPIESSDTQIESADEATEESNDTDPVSNESDSDDDDIDASHDKEADPDYDIVFPQDEVNEITISVTSETWQTVIEDLQSLYGTSNNKDRMGGMTGEDDANPIWVMADIEFEGEIWENVGFRLKGNSSLKSSVSNGTDKYPFKLDFDEFEDDYPEIEDQRFYGFKQLSFSSNFNDASYLREKVAADIFREADVPSAQTAFYAVYLEIDGNTEYMGLYTAVEVVDDTVIETQFDDDDGNVYKPDGICASFAIGTYNEECYDKETNQEEADYSDLKSLLGALHADTRTTDPEQWRSDLEAVFNVEGFIDYLAVNTVIQNWDTYGVMTHNYYLYTDPTTGLINWIPWDNNESMKDSTSGTDVGETNAGGRPSPGQNNRPGGGGGGMNKNPLSIALDEVDAKWPLIRYIMDDDVYAAMYAEAVEMVITEVFTEENMIPTYEYYAALIEDYVEQEGGNQAVSQLYNAVEQLKSHVAERVQLAEEYLRTVQ